MKILMVNSFHHARGGDATYTRALTARLEARGHTVVPLAMRHPDNDPSPWEARFVSWTAPWEARSALEVARLGARLVWSREAARAAEALIRETRPDVAHLQHIHRHLTPSVLWPLRRAGVPVVWTVHDHELICPAGTLFTEGAPCERCRGHRYEEAVRHRCKGGRLGPSLAVAVEKALHRRLEVWQKVDRFLCPSRFLADTLVRFGLPPDRVQHLPNLVDLDPDPPSDPGEGWLYAGRLTEEKGVSVAIEAARRLPGAPLTICGSGPNLAALRASARDLPHVRFVGHLPPAALASRLRAARAVAVPSIWYENFPYAVLEAQGAARAVVASRIGGIPEQIRDGEDGLLVRPGDPAALAEAIGGLLNDPARASALGAAARARVLRELRPEAHLDTLEALYGALRRDGPSGAHMGTADFAN